MHLCGQQNSFRSITAIIPRSHDHIWDLLDTRNVHLILNDMISQHTTTHIKSGIFVLKKKMKLQDIALVDVNLWNPSDQMARSQESPLEQIKDTYKSWGSLINAAPSYSFMPPRSALTSRILGNPSFPMFFSQSYLQPLENIPESYEFLSWLKHSFNHDTDGVPLQ